jgi:hypothetical protein
VIGDLGAKRVMVLARAAATDDAALGALMADARVGGLDLAAAEPVG